MEKNRITKNLACFIKRFLTTIVKISSYIAEFIGIYFFLRLLKRNKVLILMYHGVSRHNISSIENFDGKYVNRNLFEKQIKYLKKNYSPISLDNYIDSIEKSRDLPKNPVIITFDDGYKDNYTVLPPILKKYGVPITIFLPVNNIEDQRMPLHNMINFCIANTKKRFLTLDIDGSEIDYSLRDNRERLDSLVKIKSSLSNIQEDKKIRIINEILRQSDIHLKDHDEDLYCMSWSEIRKLKNALGDLVLFGSHTLTHPALNQLPSKEIEREIKSSKKIIEKRLKTDIRHFSYPFGLYNLSALNLVKQNYSSAVTTQYGYNKRNSDLFELKRISVNNMDMSIFMLTLSFNFWKKIEYMLKAYIALKNFWINI